MPNTTINIGGNTPYVLQETIGAYTDEAYTNAKKLSGSGIVGRNPNIDVNGETYIGQLRWFQPMAHVVNVASLSDSATGNLATYTSSYLTYVKTVRTHGARKVNLSKVVTQVDGLAKIGRDFAETQAQDEHNAILAVCRGVMISELLYGAAGASGSAGLGSQTFDNDPTSLRYGFYVDNGANKIIADATTSIQGAQRAQVILDSFGKAWKDYEPDWAYLVVSPQVMASLRAANLVDQDRVRDGSIDFQTIFDGKFRLISTRASQGLSAAERTLINSHATGVDLAAESVYTTFVVLPGAIAMEPIPIDEDVEIERSAGAYKGGGSTDVWYRWGYVAHPVGYNWAGPQEAFPSNADYQSVMEGGSAVALASATSGLASTTPIWTRKYSSVLTLGILPIFHA